MKRQWSEQDRVRRRRLLQFVGMAGAGIPLAYEVLRRSGKTSQLLRALAYAPARADTPTERYFLHLFLLGAADGFLAIDPVVGDKAASGKFDPTHTTAAYAPTPVTGKANLSVGLGLAPAVSAFAAMPTAFVRGLFIEVTAHPTARHYNYSGRPSLSESRVYPCISQVMANTAGGFPAHVILGSPAPLYDTAANIAPTAPLQASTAESLHTILDRPGRYISATGAVTETVTDASFAEAETLLTKLDALHFEGMSTNAQKGAADWTAATQALDPLYLKNLGSKMVPPAEMLARYGSKRAGDIGDLLAGAFKTIQAGVCSYLTISNGNFDTHSNHFALHVPRLHDFATALNGLVADLTATPAASGGNLADKTTILISTDFGRTPTLNGAEGTDHWQSGWAIAMGAGIKDNVVVGQTDASGAAMGWANATAAARTEQNALLPDHLIATILRKLGFDKAAGIVSGVNLDELVV